MTRDELLALIDRAEREEWTRLDLSGKGLTKRPLGERVHDLPERSTFRKVEGTDLVPVRELMDQLAKIDVEKKRPKWADLTRRQTPEGDILWLDQEHLQEYLSKRKFVPAPEDSL
jgi:hypothetical protein